MVVVVSGQDERRHIRWELTLLLVPEERIPLDASRRLLSCDIVRVLDHRLDNLRRALAHRMQKGLLDTLEARPPHEELDGLDALAVDGQMEGTSTHVVYAVDV